MSQLTDCVKQHRHSGQALVEFALIMPILLLILIGIIEFALLLNTYLIVQSTARDAVRQLSVGVSDAQMITDTRQSVRGIDPNQLIITINPTQGNRTRGDAVTVTMRYTHTVLTPMLSLLVGQTQVWEVQSTMRVE